MLSRLFLIAALLVSAPQLAAAASPYPDHTVRIIVPYAPGGGVDGLARALADNFSRAWNQSVIVENKSGASTMLGGEAVARAPKDGYTLLLTSDTSITSNPFLFKRQPYDPIKDLAPVTQLIDLHQIVVVHPSVPVSTLKELADYAKANPNKLSYGSYGKGSQPDLLFETVKAQTGASILPVPFRGIAPAILATLNGEVQMTLGSPAVVGQHIKAGKMKALAVGKGERLKDFPDIPTLKEAGFANAEPLSWFGLFAPAGTPPDIVAKIQQAAAAALSEPAFKARFIDAAGFEAVGSTPQAFSDFIAKDLEQKRKLIETAKIAPE